MTHPQHAYKRPESVLVVVYTHDGLVLLLRRVKPRDFWQSVTGSLRWPSETPREAAERELAEETGIRRVEDLRDWRRSFRFEIWPQWSTRFAPGVRENLEHMFSLELPAVTEVAVNPREHTAYQWVDFDVAARRVWSWTNREAIRAVAAQRTARGQRRHPRHRDA